MGLTDRGYCPDLSFVACYGVGNSYRTSYISVCARRIVLDVDTTRVERSIGCFDQLPVIGAVVDLGCAGDQFDPVRKDDACDYAIMRNGVGVSVQELHLY